MKGAALAVLVLALPVAARGEPLRLLRAELFAGLHDAGYSTVSGDTAWFSGAQANVALPPFGLFHPQVDLLGGRFSSGEWSWAAAGRLTLRSERGYLGLSYTRTQVESLSTDQLAVLGAVHEADWLTASLSLGYERKTFPEDLWFAEVFLRITPDDRWSILTGVSFAQAQIKQTRGDIVTRVEWTALSSPGLSTSVYAQYGGNLLTKASFGLVFWLDGSTAAERDRRGVATGRIK